MITENVSTLKINKLTQEQYDRALAAGNINSNEIYLTPAPIPEDGFSPSVSVEQTENGATISITDKDGTKTAEITNGNDYVLTESDKQEIADMIEIPDIPESGGTKDYTELDNKPKINGVELNGDLTPAELGLGGSDSANGEYELLNEVTTTEEVTSLLVGIPDTCYKSIFIHIATNGSVNSANDNYTAVLQSQTSDGSWIETSRIMGMVNKSCRAVVGLLITITSDMAFIFSANKRNNHIANEGESGTSGFRYSALLSTKRSIKGFRFDPVNGAGCFGVGTMIRIWGVKM